MTSLYIIAKLRSNIIVNKMAEAEFWMSTITYNVCAHNHIHVELQILQEILKYTV